MVKLLAMLEDPGSNPDLSIFFSLGIDHKLGKNCRSMSDTSVHDINLTPFPQGKILIRMIMILSVIAAQVVEHLTSDLEVLNSNPTCTFL